MKLDDMKNVMKGFVRDIVHEKVLREYPVYKQLNLSNGIESGLEEMKNFIQEMRSDCHHIEAEIDKLSDTSICDDFVIGDELEMIEFVNGKMNLETVFQSEIVIQAVQSTRNNLSPRL